MFWADQAAVLERVAAGHPLDQILRDIVLMIERQSSEMYCSILLLDEDRTTIRHGAAPSLPAEYVKLLDGQQIGPTAGSCGTAAYRGERVIVEDIATHPYWDAYRDLALPFGLRACWSSPIFSADREVLGTFAMYYPRPRTPCELELGWVDAATHLASIAIVSARTTKSLRQSEARSRHLARLYATSAAINESIIREQDAARLYEIACRIAVEHGLARVAWIGLLDGDAKKIVPMAHAGEKFERLWAIHEKLADQAASGNPTAASALGGIPAICNDMSSDPTFIGKDVPLSFGLRSCAIFPMSIAGSITGILVLYADEPNAFCDEETSVLASLADDIAFAVESAKTAAALRRSEERLRSVIEHTPDVAIQWYDKQGRIIFYNDASRRLFGWPRDEVLGKTLLEIGFWDLSEETRFVASLADAVAGRRVAPVEFRFRRADDTEGFLLSTVFRIPLSEFEDCCVCMDVDMTEHRRMEAKVRAGEALRAKIYDCVADVIFYVSVEEKNRYRFQSVNRAFLTTTGLEESEVVGRLIDEVIPESSLALVRTKYSEAIASGRKVVWEEASRYPRGIKHGEVTISPIYDSQGQCTHLIGTVHDITERRLAEQSRRQLETQLHQAQRLQALGTLAGGIAHDFNNILTAIHCNIELTLACLSTQSEAHETLSEVRRAAQRATSMVRQILTFSRKSEPRLEIIDVRPAIQEALELLRVSLKGQTKLTTVFAENIPPVMGDHTQIYQTVTNLVTNALHAIGGKPGTIELRLDVCTIEAGAGTDSLDLAEGAYVRLSVSDSGSGMDEHTLRHIFDPFFTTKAPGEGTGLGLAVVHGIMKSHKGAITVHSELGKGTTFELFFPVVEVSSEARERGTKKHQKRKRVLFVDSDEAIVFLAQRALARLGHQVSAHTGSRDALQEFRRSPNAFDVVVTDIVMPEIDGPSLIQELRHIRPDVPIVLTSGCLEADDLAVARKLGVSRILEKPQSLDDLANLVDLPIG